PVPAFKALQGGAADWVAVEGRMETASNCLVCANRERESRRRHVAHTPEAITVEFVTNNVSGALAITLSSLERKGVPIRLDLGARGADFEKYGGREAAEMRLITLLLQARLPVRDDVDRRILRVRSGRRDHHEALAVGRDVIHVCGSRE